jgi:hypothetical protein
MSKPLEYENIVRSSEFIAILGQEKKSVSLQYDYWKYPESTVCKDIIISNVKNAKTVKLTFLGHDEYVWKSDVKEEPMHIPVFTGYNHCYNTLFMYQPVILQFEKIDDAKSIELDVEYTKVMEIGGDFDMLCHFEKIHTFAPYKHIICRAGTALIIDNSKIVENFKKLSKDIPSDNNYDKILNQFLKECSQHYKSINKQTEHEIKTTIYKDKQEHKTQEAMIYYNDIDKLRNDKFLKENVVFSPFEGLTDPPYVDIKLSIHDKDKIITYIRETFIGAKVVGRRNDPMEIDEENTLKTQIAEREATLKALKNLDMKRSPKYYTIDEINNDPELRKSMDKFIKYNEKYCKNMMYKRD